MLRLGSRENCATFSVELFVVVVGSKFQCFSSIFSCEIIGALAPCDMHILPAIRLQICNDWTHVVLILALLCLFLDDFGYNTMHAKISRCYAMSRTVIRAVCACGSSGEQPEVSFRVGNVFLSVS